MLQLIYNDEDGQRRSVPLRAGAVVTIGRNADSTLRIRNPSVSRAHAQIFEEQGRWVVRDLGSSNRTFINDAETTQGLISPGDEVRFGDFKVTVQGSLSKASSAAASSVPAAPSRGSARANRSHAPGHPAQAPPAPPRRAPSSPQPEQQPASPSSDAAEASRQPAPPRRTPPARKKDEVEQNAGRAKPNTARTKGSDQKERRQAPSPGVRRASASPGRQTRPQRSPSKVEPSVAPKDDLVPKLQAEIVERDTRIEELEQRIKELEIREERKDDELDGWHERYNRVREQVDHVQELIEQKREELQDRDDEVSRLEEQNSEIESQLAAIEATATEASELTGELKARVVQKDRRIDELQRELDMMEYDLRQVREENEAFLDSINGGGAEVRRLERETTTLRAVITEKENIISELKLELEEQSREIYNLKLGTGVKDLEEAKRDVLEQYFEKNREVDALTEQLQNVKRDNEDLKEQLSESEERIAEQKDISSHPDFERKLRELERTQEDLSLAHEENNRLEAKLSQFGPEEKARIEAQLNFLERKNRALQEKLEQQDSSDQKGLSSDERDQLREEIESLRSALTEAKAAQDVVEVTSPGQAAVEQQHIGVEATEAMTLLQEAFEAMAGNAGLLRAYADDAAEATSGGPASEAIESLRDLLVVVNSDASELRSALKAMKKHLMDLA